MSKVNQVEKILQEIDATKFHKLADGFLSKKLSYEIHSNGTKLGEDKPTKGTPDSFTILENGHYVFMEYTTQKTNITEKFLNDLEKCFDEEKTGIPVNQIEKIILACNSDLNPEEIRILSDYCKAKDTGFTFFGNSSIANELLMSYPTIAKEFLDISPDSGQILDYEDFIKTYDANKYSTSLNTSLQHRETEVEKFKKCLDSNTIVLVTGASGVGKTKFALESSQQYSNEHSFVFKAILNRGVNIFDDIKAYFDDESEHYLVLIDDVNRVHAALEYFQDYYGDKIKNGSLKIVASVRDYAKEKIVFKIPSSISHTEIELKQLTDESIQDIVKQEYHITNTAYLERIADISQGNPRLALMAASIAKEQNRLDAIYDVTTLYDEYFSRVKEDINAFEQSDLLLCITIIAFFRVVDRANTQQVDLLENAFGISITNLWKSVEELNVLEIVDLYENDVVKVSDQILSTYLFYKIVFVDKKIKVDIFLEHFFPRYKGRFVDILNPLLNTFDSQLIMNVLREPVDKLWIQSKENEIDLFAVMNVFWFLKQTDILAYFASKISGIESENVDNESLDFWQKINTNTVDELLSRLSVFKHDYSDNMRFAIELIIGYFEKKPSKLSEVITVLADSFGYQQASWRNNYVKEQLLVDTLWEYCDNGENELITKLFLRISSKLLKTEFDDHRQKGKSIVMTYYKLPETDELKFLRKSIFEKITSLYGYEKYKNDIETLIQKYPEGLGYRYGISEIEKWDANNIFDFIQTYFDAATYEHCKIVQDLCSEFDRRGINYDLEIKNTFQHPISVIETILMLDDVAISLENPKEEQTDWDEIRLVRKNRLSMFVKAYKLKEWEQLLEVCHSFFFDNSRELYKLRNNLSDLFHILAKKDHALYIEVLEKYLKMGNPFELSVNILDFIEALGKKEALSLLNRYEYLNKGGWLFNFFVVLPKEQITIHDAKQLLEVYKVSTVQAIPYHLDYLEKYNSVQPNMLLQVVDILTQRAMNENKHFTFGFEIIFNSHSEIFKSLDDHFKSNTDLLGKAYLLCVNQKNHFDYNCASLSKLLNMDNSFIEKYIHEILSKERHFDSHDIQGDFTLIWDRPDYESVFLRFIEAVFTSEQASKIWRRGEILQGFFSHHDNQKEVDQKADILLKKYIEENSSDEARMIYIFELICEFSYDRREELIAYFLEQNQSYKLFEKLSLEPMIHSWSGSRIPTLQKEVDYYESLLKHMKSLKLIKHKQKIEQHIHYLKNDIEHEKKNDFMEDDY